MSVFAKVSAYVHASQLLFQRNFNEASEKSPNAAHVQGVMLAVVVAALCCVFVVGLGSADYRAARSFLEHGSAANGIAERVNRQIPLTVGPRKYHVTTVEYRFLASDGRSYRGTSVTKARTPPAISAGDAVEVVYDQARPQNNAWRTALQMTISDVHAGIFASLLLLPWLGLMLYRYARWAAGRWTRVTACA